MYDFGCMRLFKSKFIQGVIDLYYALQKKDEALAVHAYEQWGFNDITKEKLKILSKWANFLYAPLMEDKIQKIQESENGIYGAQIASEVHRELKKIGGTVGEYENILFMEAARMMKQKHKHDVAYVLVSYLPVPAHIGEMKTKPK